jgi:glycosyltransferase involved in cell wall biosynthesis
MNSESGSAKKFSIVIPTYNRASELRQTLASLAQLRVSGSWEAIVVDNNSSDDTREVVNDAAKGFPVELRYFFEPKVGRSAALNTGIRAANGQIIATTDDDVRVETDWLDQAEKGLEQGDSDFVGGKVLPIWPGPKPAWISNQGGRHWSVIALLDYGPRPVEFGKRYPALGVNLAFRRRAFERVGLWNSRIGRKAGTLLGQEVREWCMRAREAGLKGMYVPGMVVHHVIPQDRLNKRYFRRWFYWHGISRAMLYQQRKINMLSPEETDLDFSKVPHVLGVPRYMYRTLLRSIVGVFRAKLGGDGGERFDHELWLWFFLGMFRQRWRDRNLGEAESNPSDVSELRT